MSLLEELKRRNVFRVAIAYIVAAWVVIQVADIVLENIGAPEWFFQALFLLLAIGFAAAVIISWAFEVTPDGIRRESEVDRSQSVTHETGKRLNIITIALVLVAVGLLAADRLVPPDDQPARDAVTAEVATGTMPSRMDTGVDQRSIAVLPFVALSDDSSDAYFGKGIAEELLNTLAQFADLKVAARTSAFSFDGKDVDLRVVADSLGVAHVLEGSVRRAGDRVRVTAQLIRAQDGFHLWSETYERKMTDIFRIQDEIVANLARVLQFRLGVGVGTGRAESRDVNAAAYEEYLRGLELWWARELADNRVEAINTLRRATELDANFADAWSALGASLALSPVEVVPFLTPESFRDYIEDAFARALALDPMNVRAHAGLAFWFIFGSIDVDKAAYHLDRALQLSPNGSFTNYAAANYYFTTADREKAFDQYERALRIDPLNETLKRVRFESFAGMGRYVAPPEKLLEGANCAGDECNRYNAYAAQTILFSAIVSGKQAVIRESIDRLVAIRSVIDPVDEELRATLAVSLYLARQLAGEPADTASDTLPDAEMSAFRRNTPWSACAIAVRLNLSNCDFERLKATVVQGGTFSNITEVFPLQAGDFEMPESVRRDPRYHEIWSLPGMPGLAAARRANGVSAGLPLPMDAVSGTQ